MTARPPDRRRARWLAWLGGLAALALVACIGGRLNRGGGESVARHSGHGITSLARNFSCAATFTR